MPPWSRTGQPVFTRVCLLFCTTHYCEVNLTMDLGQLMSTSRLILRVPCITSCNHRNVSPCSGLVKKSAYISLIRLYFSEKYLFLIRLLIKNYCTRMCFFFFVLDSFPFFYIIVALILSCCNSSSSTVYPCPSINYLDHRHCGKASSAPTISDSIEILPFIFCFRNISIFRPGTMYIIAPV